MGDNGLAGQLDAYVTADLANPHRLSLEGRRGTPKPQMIAFINGFPGFLKGRILRAAKQIQR
jgi:hypothetical protein